MNLLVISIFLPLVGAAAVWAMAPGGKATARMVALITVIATLICAGLVVADFDPSVGDQYAIDLQWLGLGDDALDVRFSLGLDGLSVWLYGLSALLMITSVLVSWEAIDDRAPAFYTLLLLLESGMLGVFAARDIMLFYVFFEFTLIPLFFLIGMWGYEERRYAAVKFFVYTLAGSVLTFLGLIAIILWVYFESGTMTFSIARLGEELAATPLPKVAQWWIFIALFAGFAVKVPLFPFHTWLPLAHVQAPTAGSVILAGILLKIGTYGFVRFSIPMLPDASAALMPFVLWLSVAGIIYGALVALAQSDMKRLIAYSSVSHLGFCMLGLFAFNKLGIQGGMLQMINHGLSTGALFALVGMLYERYHTREIKELGGLARRTPWLAACMLLMTFSSIGLPGLNGFAGEFLLLIGMFQRAWAEAPGLWQTQFLVIAVLAVSGVVLGAWYMLWLIQRVFFGPLNEATHAAGDPPVRDLSLRELAAIAPIAVFVFWIGLQPQFFLKRMEPAVDELVATVAPRVPQVLVEGDDGTAQDEPLAASNDGGREHVAQPALTGQSGEQVSLTIADSVSLHERNSMPPPPER